MSEKRELVFAAFDNKKTERVPVGFWFHFAPDSLFVDKPETIQRNIEGHKSFYESFQPDFVKLMSDGYFVYPNESAQAVKSVKDLAQVKASGTKEWIDAQVKLVKTLTGQFGQEVATFYNIFAPATYFKFLLEASGSGLTLGKLLKEDPESVAHALGEIGKDVSELARRVIQEGGADGIYLSVQNIQDAGLTKEEYLKYVAPGELAVLKAANAVSEYNILHICGYEGAKNDLSVYVDYPAKVINWAVVVEGVPLEEGKKLFANRAVIGGFDNTENGVLYKGSKEQIEAETERLIKGAGTQGIILGADCTIPSDTPLEHLEWVRNKAKEITL